MAKFQDKHLKLRYNHRAYFGDNDDCSIWHDGTGMRISCTISGVDPQQDYHLTTKNYVDNKTFLDLPDTPSTYSGSENYLVTVNSTGDGLDFTSVSGLAEEITEILSGDFVTITGTQTITGDKTFDNSLTTFLGDVFFDGITITMSGTTLNTEAGAVFNYDSTSTTNNAGDTNYQNGAEVTYESGSTETHESGSTVENYGDTNYYSGSTITTSGTDINHESGTTINYGDNVTETHEDGSSEVYEGGSITTHESGSEDHYLPGSILTFSGAQIDSDDTTVFNFNDDSTINYNDNSVVTYADGTTEIHEGGSTTIFEDNSIVTYSGSNITYEGDTVINVGGDTITNYNDGSVTNFNEGSTVTFSGTTVFETITYFNEDIVAASGTTTYLWDLVVSGTLTIASGTEIVGLCHSDLDCLGADDHLQYVPTDGSRGFTATVSGIDPVADSDLATKWYVDQATDMHKETGRTALALNDSSKAVTFGTAFGDTNYSVSVIMNNTTDSNPSIYPMIISNKTSSGFTVIFSGDIDSNNYFLEWIAVDDD